mgnify:CR=1 FL=1
MLDSRSLELVDMDCTEKYSELVTCGGQTMLFSRIEHYDTGSSSNREPQPHSQIVVRRLRSHAHMGRLRSRAHMGQPVFSHSQLAMAEDKPYVMAGNTGFMCEGTDLLAFGGGNGGSGVAMVRTQIPDSAAAMRSAPFLWSAPERKWSGKTAESGCVEERPYHYCEFDSKLSVARLGSRLLVFSRANHFERGGRHVQVTFIDTADAIPIWSRFRQLRIDGVRILPENNIYYMAVRTVHAGTCTILLGTFPAAIDHQGGVYASVSANGIRWSRPARIMRSQLHAEWRTADHPVDAASAQPISTPSTGQPPDRISIAIQHNVVVPTKINSTAWPGDAPYSWRPQDYCPSLPRATDAQGAPRAASTWPFFCEYDFAWTTARLNSSYIRVQLGGFEPWDLAVRGCDGGSGSSLPH